MTCELEETPELYWAKGLLPLSTVFFFFFFFFFPSLLYYFPVSLLNDQNFYILCVISQNEQSTGWRQGDAASGPEDGNHKRDGDGNSGGHGGMPLQWLMS